MDIIDLKKIPQFLLECSNKYLPIYLIEIGKNKELIFKPQKPNPTFSGKINEHCNIYFDMVNKTYTFSGKLFCPTMERFIVVNISPVLPDRRTEKRYPVPSLITHIKEMGSFGHLNIIEGHAIDINLKGVRIQNLVSLQIGIIYEVEINLVYKHQIYILKSNIVIKNVIKQGFNYYCGCQFINMDDKNKKILEEYILDIQGKLRKDFLNVENFTIFTHYFMNFINIFANTLII
jgi:hypothetical protein